MWCPSSTWSLNRNRKQTIAETEDRVKTGDKAKIVGEVIRQTVSKAVPEPEVGPVAPQRQLAAQ